MQFNKYTKILSFSQRMPVHDIYHATVFTFHCTHVPIKRNETQYVYVGQMDNSFFLPFLMKLYSTYSNTDKSTLMSS